MSIDENRAVFKRFCDALMGHGSLEEVVDPQIVIHLPAGEQATGFDAYQMQVKGLQAAFPDQKISIEDSVVEGDKVAARLVITGTHSGEPFYGVPASAKGKPLHLDEHIIVRIKDGRIAEQWVQADIISMMQKLGMAA